MAYALSLTACSVGGECRGRGEMRPPSRTGEGGIAWAREGSSECRWVGLECASCRLYRNRETGEEGERSEPVQGETLDFEKVTLTNHRYFDPVLQRSLPSFTRSYSIYHPYETLPVAQRPPPDPSISFSSSSSPSFRPQRPLVVISSLLRRRIPLPRTVWMSWAVSKPCFDSGRVCKPARKGSRRILRRW